MDTMRELAIWLGSKQVELFENNQPVYMDVFCSGEAVRKIICEYYDTLVKQEKIVRIEDLPDDHKKYLKESEKEIAKGRLDTAGRIQLCKCLHVLTYHKTLNINDNGQQEVPAATEIQPGST